MGDRVDWGCVAGDLNFLANDGVFELFLNQLMRNGKKLLESQDRWNLGWLDGGGGWIEGGRGVLTAMQPCNLEDAGKKEKVNVFCFHPNFQLFCWLVYDRASKCSDIQKKKKKKN